MGKIKTSRRTKTKNTLGGFDVGHCDDDGIEERRSTDLHAAGAVCSKIIYTADVIKYRMLQACNLGQISFSTRIIN